MTGRMRTSAAGLELIKTFEGLRESAVRLPDGRWTIGYGHVRTAREGLTITAQDADGLLVHDLRPIEAAISAMVFAPLMQGQFDALVSLAFNISLGQFRQSEIVGHLNAGNYLAAANGFDLWRKARLNGRVMVVDALVRRRAAEKALFLEHPSGHPAAPTPLVTPEMDFGNAEPPPRATAPARDDDEPEAPPTVTPDTDSEIARAVRRLAESMQGAVRPAQEIPLPPGSVVAADPPRAAATIVETFVETIVETSEEPERPANDHEPEAAPEPRPEPRMTAEQIARASRTMAERVASILNGVESRIQAQEDLPADEPAAQPSRPAARAEAPRASVREGLPDFDLPPERFRAEASGGARQLIDDTEVVETGRNPADLFAEAERKAKLVNGHARRVGPLSGRVLVLAPWIIVLALSALGFVIGAVDTFKGNGLEAGVPRLAATLLAVFGVMMVMSLYFIFWKRTSDDT